MAKRNATNSLVSDITKNKITTPKALMLVCAILSLIIDAVVIAMLAINTSELKFFICPALLFVLDIIYLIKVMFSSYRFAYAVNGTIVHAVCATLIGVISIILTGSFDGQTIIFRAFTLYAMPIVHILQCMAALYMALTAAHGKSILHTAVKSAVCAVFALSVIIYGNQLITTGFFGQSAIPEERTVVYSLDESGDFYVVSDVLDGRGRNLVIPETFNDKPVLGVDCKIFEKKDLSRVILECSPDIDFVNFKALTNANDELTLETPKAYVDSIRLKLFSLAYENSEILALANGVIPSDMGENEVYMTFTYSLAAFTEAEGKIIPTWFGDKNDHFNIYEHAYNVSYVEHCDVESVADLYWCHKNQDSKIYRQYVHGTDEIIASTGVIENSLRVDVIFDQIYQLNFSNDNDDLYEIAESEKKIETVDGEQSYKLSTSDKIASILAAFTQRKGFDLFWGFGLDKSPITNFDETLNEIKSAGLVNLTFYPIWQLRNPSILSMSANGKDSAENPRATYGDNVAIKSDALPPDESISLRYLWTKGQDSKAQSKDFDIINIHPEDAGEYKLTVTAYSNTSSLTSSVSASLNLGFNKKTLSVTPQLDSDNIYSASDKMVIINYGNVINDDKITHTLSQVSVRNAGNYEIKITLTGDANKKYQIPAPSSVARFTILPCTVDAIWSNLDTLVYNGTEQAPSAVVNGIGDDPEVEIALSGHKINAGTHTASVKSQNANYTISAETEKCSYTIARKPITSIMWDEDKFEYNAVAQGPSILYSDNILQADRNSVIKEISYTNKEVNVGSYTVSASLPETSNYIFECDTDKEYTIIPKNLSVVANDKTVTYSGMLVTNFGITVTGKAGNDKDAQIFTVTYSGNATSAIDASDEPYQIDLILTPGEKYNNYNIEVTSGSLTIERKSMTVTIHNANKVYDKKVYPVSTYTFTHNGLCDVDSIESVLSVNYTGPALDSTDAGTYKIEADIIEAEKAHNYNISVITGTLTITKAPLTVTVTGGTKVYDGLTASGFSSVISGIVPGDSEHDFDLNYSGAATTNKNVGTHALTAKCTDNSVSRNYNITYVAGTYTITKAPLTVTVHSGSKVYDGKVGSNFGFDISGLVPGDKEQSFTPTYTGEAATNKNVGVHTLTMYCADNTVTRNYDITYVSGTYTITKAPLTVAIKNSSKVYNGKVESSFPLDITGLASSDTAASLAPTYSGSATTAKNVGTYDVSVRCSDNTVAGNYDITYVPGSFTITKAPLTVAIKNNSKIYDGKVEEGFTLNVTGLASGDTAASLEPTYSGSATTAKNVGTYDISVRCANNSVTSNYDITYITGKFTITPKAITVTAVATDRAYDKNVTGGEFSYTVDGLADGDSASDLGTPEYSGNATTASAVGSYTLNVSFADNQTTKNYSITYVAGTFTIYEVADQGSQQ